MITAATYADFIREQLQQFYGAHRHAAKTISKLIGTTPRTAENWLDGLNAPRGAELLRLMVENEQFADEINSLVREARACRDQ